MTDINETIIEVLRLDAQATQGPWRYEPRWGSIYITVGSPPYRSVRGATTDYSDGSAIVGDGGKEVVYEGTFVRYEQTAGHIGIVEEDRTLIAYYRTAAPALAREVQRLQGDVERLCVLVDYLREEEEPYERDRLQAEVQRLQGEVLQAQTGHDCALVAAYESAHRAGQEAMRERAAEVCGTRHQEHWSRVLVAHNGYAHDRAEGMADEAEECADAIRALEVEP